MKEIWKVYRDNRRGKFGCLWEVSNFGNVKKNGVVIKPHETHSGYSVVNHFYVHKLVAKLFIENPLNKPQVDHIDTNKQNNNVNNLRWVTSKENSNNQLTRQHLSEAKKNQSLETRKKISIAMKGRPKSKEFKTMLSKILKGSINEKNRGKNNGMYGKVPGNSKKVYQYTKEWEFVGEWETTRKAEQTLGIHGIGLICKGKGQTAGGYRWSYTKI